MALRRVNFMKEESECESYHIREFALVSGVESRNQTRLPSLRHNHQVLYEAFQSVQPLLDYLFSIGLDESYAHHVHNVAHESELSHLLLLSASVLNDLLRYCLEVLCQTQWTHIVQ